MCLVGRYTTQITQWQVVKIAVPIETEVFFRLRARGSNEYGNDDNNNNWLINNMPPKKNKGDGVKGESIYKNLCTACHSLQAHSVGPSLGGLSGTNIAS